MRLFLLNLFNRCHTCYLRKARHHYVLGHRRCNKCDADMRACIYISKLIEDEAKQTALLAHIEAGCPDDGVFCPNCCLHEEHGHGLCLDCETDITDSLISAAEAYFEGDR